MKDKQKVLDDFEWLEVSNHSVHDDIEVQDVSFVWVKRLTVVVFACVVALIWLG